jgi:transcriptional regulator with XRE-family HTH domain
VARKRDVSEVVASALKRLGWKGAKLAERLGVKRCTVARWKTGSRRPSRKMVEKMAKLLGVKAEELL